ncbi:MAG: gamma-glutamylcyclotransferase [Rubrivivax sp.]
MKQPGDDPFRHLPGLRARIKPAEQSELRVTPDVLSMWTERARLLGRPADWRWSDDAIEASRLSILGGLPADEDLWVFGYGSLMWDPGFHFTEVRLAELAGFQRRFSYRTTLGRGCPERPGLMLAIERCAGDCHGLAFRVAAEVAQAESSIVWRREMIRGGYSPVLLPLRTPQGPLTALSFAPNLAHPDHVGELPLLQTAAHIASGVGVLGTNREYLEFLVAQLEHLGIDDAYMNELLVQVRRVPASC